MSSRDSKRFGLLISPNDMALPVLPESPTSPSHPRSRSRSRSHSQSKQYHRQQTAADMSLPSPPSSSSPPGTAGGNGLSGYRPHPHSRSQSYQQAQLASSSSSSSSSLARPRKSSMRRQPPSGLQIDSNNNSRLGVPRKMGGDFPSPGSAPKNHRIFDAAAVAENKGVETAQPGWAVDSRTQDKLEEDQWRLDHPEEFETLLQRSKSTMTRSLSTVKRSASMSVKRAKSLRRPRAPGAGASRLEESDMPPPPPFEDEDAKMVRMSIIKPHDY